MGNGCSPYIVLDLPLLSSNNLAVESNLSPRIPKEESREETRNESSSSLSVQEKTTNG